ncbi:MAG: phage head morphogenesis protein, partial [Acinetobacter sp.]
DEREGLVGQVNANTKFPTWFAKQDEAFQKSWLGDARYKLYKEGGYKIEKFLDPLGKEYTLAELKLLDEKIFKKLGLK